MSNKKKILLNVLWFLVGMVAIVAIPLLVLEQCSQARKPEIRENQGQKQGAVDHSVGKQVVCGNLIITYHAA
ncbi:MAG: hypothetical protein ACXWMC_11560 [Syntrophales bacterium]